MKPETEIRNLKRKVNDLSAAFRQEFQTSADYRARATKAEQDAPSGKPASTCC